MNSVQEQDNEYTNSHSLFSLIHAEFWEGGGDSLLF